MGKLLGSIGRRRRTLPVALLVAAVALLGLAPLQGVHAREPGVDARASQFAYATNIVRKNGADYMYLVGAQRSSYADGRTRTTAFAKRSKCLTLEKKHIKLIACAAFVFPRKIADDAFVFDPLLGSASVRFANKDGRTNMSWTGRGTPEPDAGPWVDPGYGGGAYAEAYRIARASGKILDEPYPGGRLGFGLLIEGASVDAWTARNLTITPAKNGALKIEARWRIPR